MKGRARRTAAIAEMNFMAGAVVLVTLKWVGTFCSRCSPRFYTSVCRFDLLINMTLEQASAINRIRVFEIDDKKHVNPCELASNRFSADRWGYVVRLGQIHYPS